MCATDDDDGDGRLRRRLTSRPSEVSQLAEAPENDDLCIRVSFGSKSKRFRIFWATHARDRRPRILNNRRANQRSLLFSKRACEWVRIFRVGSKNFGSENLEQVAYENWFPEIRFRLSGCAQLVGKELCKEENNSAPGEVLCAICVRGCAIVSVGTLERIFKWERKRVLW